MFLINLLTVCSQRDLRGVQMLCSTYCKIKSSILSLKQKLLVLVLFWGGGLEWRGHWVLYAASLKVKAKKMLITGNPLNYPPIPANHAASSFLAAAYRK